MVARCPRTTRLTALLLCGFTRNSTLESVRLVMTRHYTTVMAKWHGIF